jgi:hypothetical protein
MAGYARDRKQHSRLLERASIDQHQQRRSAIGASMNAATSYIREPSAKIPGR